MGSHEFYDSMGSWRAQRNVAIDMNCLMARAPRSFLAFEAGKISAASTFASLASYIPLIKLIQASLQDPSDSDGKPAKDFVFVEFNAWLCQGYDDARVAPMDVIATRLELRFKPERRGWKRSQISLPALVGCAPQSSPAAQRFRWPL